MLVQDDPYFGDAVEGYYASEMAAHQLRSDPVWRAAIGETDRFIASVDKELNKHA